MAHCGDYDSYGTPAKKRDDQLERLKGRFIHVEFEQPDFVPAHYVSMREWVNHQNPKEN